MADCGHYSAPLVAARSTTAALLFCPDADAVPVRLRPDPLRATLPH